MWSSEIKSHVLTRPGLSGSNITYRAVLAQVVLFFPTKKGCMACDRIDVRLFDLFSE